MNAASRASRGAPTLRSAQTALDAAAVWSDLAVATELFAIDPSRLGGVVLRARPGPPRDRITSWVRAWMPEASPVLRVPLHITEDRLLGGLSLAATLQTGRVVIERGLLADADEGALLVAMAERIEPLVVSHLCSAIDRGELTLERDGVSAVTPCRIGIVALDEGIDDERTPDALRDRLAIHLDLTDLDPRSVPPEPDFASEPRDRVARARKQLPQVELDGAFLETLVGACDALGIPSLRAPILAAAVARAHAALEGRTRVIEEDITLAARLVLGPRATRVPEPPPPEEADREESEPEDPAETPEPPDAPETDPNQDMTPREIPPPLDDLVLEAAKSGIPAGLLDLLALGKQPRSAPRSSGRSGALRASVDGGRPAGTRSGLPRPGERLNIVETLRAAAPWQALRRRERGANEPRRIEVRKADFRVRRFQQKTETNVIFCVDASGSSALQRLSEAKGAVEQVLGDCYVRRDHVALVAFRGQSATLLLPPTRSLVRVRRCLAELAGGGETPIASGIDAALALALEARKRGRTPLLVFMTDGRANMGRSGQSGAAAGMADALASARAVYAAGVRALFLDTAPRPRPQARDLALAMAARYLPLPYLDAAGISRHVQALAEGAS